MPPSGGGSPSPWKEAPPLGGSPSGGVPPSGGLRGGGVSQHALRQTPPPVNRITHTRVKKLPWPQLRCGR